MLRAVVLAAILAVPSFPAQTVTGQVTNAATGAPIHEVAVRIFPADAGPSNGRSVRTDTQGRFQFDDVPDGAWRVIYRAPGFTPIPEPGAQGLPFAVVSGAQPVRLTASMKPLLKLSGRVVDPGGKPVPNAKLWLIDADRACKPPNCNPFTQQSESNDRGEFVFANLDIGGPWLLSATASSSLKPPPPRGDEHFAWAQTYYPGVADPELAQIIPTPPTGELSDLDIKLAAATVHHIRGSVTGPNGGNLAKISVEMAKGFGPAFSEETNPDGTFDFPSATDGTWVLSAAVREGRDTFRTVQGVEVNGSDVEDIKLHLAAAFTLRGRVVLETPEGTPAPEVPPIDLILVPSLVLSGHDAASVIRVKGGDLLAEKVYPGTYFIQQISEPPLPYYLDSIRLGTQDASGATSIVSDAEPLIVTYKLGGGSFRGTVEGCTGGQVLLVPQDPKFRRIGFLRIEPCGPRGSFEIAGIRPGDYYTFAFTGAPRFSVVNDPALLQRAARVTIRANESASAEIPLLSR